MRKAFFLLGVALFAFAAIYAYTGLTPEPSTEVVGTDYEVVDSFSLFGVNVPTNVSVSAEIKVDNPKIIPLTLEGGSFKLYLNDDEIGEGSFPEDVTIPAKASSTFTAASHISGQKTVAAIINNLEKKEFTVKAKGYVVVSAPLLGEHQLKFDESRKIM